MHTIPTCLHTCVHTHGYDPFWSPSYLYSPTHALSSPAPQHIKRPRSASWHSSFSSQDLERIFRNQRLAPEGRVLNQVGWQWKHVIGSGVTSFPWQSQDVGTRQASSRRCWLTMCGSQLPQGPHHWGLAATWETPDLKHLPDGGTLVSAQSSAASFT